MAFGFELAVSVARRLGTKAMWMFNLLLPLVMRLARFMGIERHLQAVISWLGVDPAICSSRPPVIQVFTIVIGNTLGCHESFLELLKTQVTLKRVDSVMECDVILAFCPIVSRVGTDIGAALPRIPDCKPAILVVLHHTFDADYVIPSASKFILDRNIRIVDCLFYDSGLLTSHQNDNAVKKMVAHLKENKTIFLYGKAGLLV